MAKIARCRGDCAGISAGSRSQDVANQPTDTNRFTLHPDVRAAAAFGAAEVSGAVSELSRDLSANILLILRPRSAGVKGFWMSDTPAISISARINSPL